MQPITASDLTALLPVLVLSGTAVVVLVADLLFGKEGDERVGLPFLTLAGTLSAIGSLASMWGRKEAAFGGSLVVDPLGLLAAAIICGATAVTALSCVGYLTRRGINFGEFYALLLFGAAGMVLLAMSGDLVMILLSLETLSIAAYVLTGITRDRPQSNEAAIKYFVLGAFATAVLLFGMALVYGATGEIRLAAIQARIGGIGDMRTLAIVGLGLIAIGLAFKIGAVPFHMWVPDAYEGAPSAVSGFMASAVKVAAFAALVRLLLRPFLPFATEWGPLVWWLSAITIVVGNLFAVTQTNVKRLLAYSSIAHTGYALIGVAVASVDAEAAGGVVFYLLSYSIMTLGAFAVVSTIAKEGKDVEDLAQWAGLAHRRPGIAAAMTVFLVSLAGIPPTAGFIGKFTLFRDAVHRGFTGLALIGVLGTLLSLYYYLKVVMTMYMKDPAEDFERKGPQWGLHLAVGATAVATLAIGILPAFPIRLALKCVQGLF